MPTQSFSISLDRQAGQDEPKPGSSKKPLRECNFEIVVRSSTLSLFPHPFLPTHFIRTWFIPSITLVSHFFPTLRQHFFPTYWLQ